MSKINLKQAYFQNKKLIEFSTFQGYSSSDMYQLLGYKMESEMQNIVHNNQEPIRASPNTSKVMISEKKCLKEVFNQQLIFQLFNLTYQIPRPIILE